MPLLPLEPFVYPEDLLQDGPRTVESAHQWWVLHVRPRAEKALARRLWRSRHAFFLPLYDKLVTQKGRKQRSFLPLFPGYVFLWGDAETRLAALATNVVAQVLPVGNQDELGQDLARVRRLMGSGQPLLPETRLEPGQEVVIARGPLVGVQGRIIQRARPLRFLVEVRLLQRGVSVELEEWMLEPAEQSATRPVAFAS